MKKNLRRIILTVLVICILSTGFVAMATWGWEKIGVAYADIRVVADGREIIPTDANGNAVEPFIYNNTTYIPLRTVADIVDGQISWAQDEYTAYYFTRDYMYYPDTMIPTYKPGVDPDKEEINREEGYSAYWYNVKDQTQEEIDKYEMLLVAGGMEMEVDGDKFIFNSKDYEVTTVFLTDGDTNATYFCVFIAWEV